MSEGDHLKQLGSNKTKYVYNEPSLEILEVFDNKTPNRDYMVELVFPEFTSHCPKTGQPDFATITIRYVPRSKCIETKSLKLYFFAYRNHGAFMESITNKILADLVHVLDPRWIEVHSKFNSRGGITLEVLATDGEE